MSRKDAKKSKKPQKQRAFSLEEAKKLDKEYWAKLDAQHRSEMRFLKKQEQLQKQHEELEKQVSITLRLEPDEELIAYLVASFITVLQKDRDQAVRTIDDWTRGLANEFGDRDVTLMRNRIEHLLPKYVLRDIKRVRKQDKLVTNYPSDASNEEAPSVSEEA